MGVDLERDLGVDLERDLDLDQDPEQERQEQAPEDHRLREPFDNDLEHGLWHDLEPVLRARYHVLAVVPQVLLVADPVEHRAEAASCCRALVPGRDLIISKHDKSGMGCDLAVLRRRPA